jgi:acetyl-CoA acetyltransferase
MSERCAVIGIGQTEHRESRKDVSLPGLLREALFRALEDADRTLADMDAIVIGTAPDMFEGVMMPELFMADALGAVGKPIFRVHTAGSVGGSTAVVASHLIENGMHQQVLTLAFEKQSEANAMWALSPAIPFQPQLVAGAGGYFAPLIRSYMARHDAHPDAGPMVAVKDRENGLLNPKAHLHLKQTLDEVKASPMLWDPIRYSETCPSSDGAVAMVLANDKHAKGCKNPAWILGTSVRTERTFMAGRDQVNPKAGQMCAKDVYDQARHRPAQGRGLRRDLRALLVVRAHVAREPRLLRAGRGLEVDHGGQDPHRRSAAPQHERRRALHQPHRRQRHDPLRRGRAPGARHRRAAPGGRRQDRHRSRLRRRLAVLRHVGRR